MDLARLATVPVGASVRGFLLEWDILGNGLVAIRMTHYYAWKNNQKRITLYKRRCRIIARLVLNSAIVEFENGQREVVSRNALRRLPPNNAACAANENN